jgi:hypothetical protein
MSDTQKTFDIPLSLPAAAQLLTGLRTELAHRLQAGDTLLTENCILRQKLIDALRDYCIGIQSLNV